MVMPPRVTRCTPPRHAPRARAHVGWRAKQPAGVRYSSRQVVTASHGQSCFITRKRLRITFLRAKPQRNAAVLCASLTIIILSPVTGQAKEGGVCVWCKGECVQARVCVCVRAKGARGKRKGSPCPVLSFLTVIDRHASQMRHTQKADLFHHHSTGISGGRDHQGRR